MLKRPLLSVFSVLLALVLLNACQPTEEQILKKAEKIHAEVLTVDTHCDTPMRLVRGGFDLGEKNERGRVDFPRMKEGGLDAMFFAVFLGQGPRTPEAFERMDERATGIFEAIHASVEKNADQAGLALTPEDAYRLEAEGKRAAFIGIENGYPIGKDLSRVEKFYNMGARYITLSHSRNNDICDSSTDPNGPEHDGLSSFGEEVVKEMNRLGMMVDVSHISDAAFYDVLEVTEAPVIASHSCSRALCESPRNLTDDMLLALKKNGGVMQMCLLSNYLKPAVPNPEKDAAMAALREKYNNFENMSKEVQQAAQKEWEEINDKYPDKGANVQDVVDHIDHVVQVAGIDYVGIGSDFDGGGGIEGCNDVSEMKNITIELVRRGYSKAEIEKIWGGNVMRVFGEVMAKAGK